MVSSGSSDTRQHPSSSKSDGSSRREYLAELTRYRAKGLRMNVNADSAESLAASRRDLFAVCEESNRLIRKMDLGQADERFLSLCFDARVLLALAKRTLLETCDDLEQNFANVMKARAATCEALAMLRTTFATPRRVVAAKTG